MIAATTPSGRRVSIARPAESSCNTLSGRSSAARSPQDARGLVHLEIGAPSRLALFLREQRRQLADGGFDVVGQLQQQRPAILPGPGRPRGERGVGGGDRHFSLRGGRARTAGQHRAGRRIDDVHGRCPVHQTAIDQQLELAHSVTPGHRRWKLNGFERQTRRTMADCGHPGFGLAGRLEALDVPDQRVEQRFGFEQAPATGRRRRGCRSPSPAGHAGRDGCRTGPVPAICADRGWPPRTSDRTARPAERR
jgi:hypothetical protein